MNNRQKELLRMLLLNEEGALQIKDLAAELECAEKTVRNDLNRLENVLHDYKSVNLIRKPGLGISIEGSKKVRSDILRDLFLEEPKSEAERLYEMAYQLLTSDKAITLQYWAERYFQPKSVIKNDIETIGTWLDRYELELVSRQRMGNIIQGSELNKRNALAHLSELSPTHSSDKNVVLDLFPPYEIAIVKKDLKDMKNRFQLAFTDNALDSLLVHALIMVKRTRQKSFIFADTASMEVAIKSKQYEYANWLFNRLEDAFRLKFPEEEKVYFTWHLISGKRMEGELQQLKEQEEVEELVRALIDELSDLTSVPFYKDPILKPGLAVHMHSVVNRIRFGFPITNPLLANIKKMYPYMFSMVILSLEEINEKFETAIFEDEAAYIVLHFQAALERLNKTREKDKKKVLIVCHLGIGMSHLLEAKIEQQYPDIEIVDCIGRAELTKSLSERQVDFIISTVPLEKVDTDTIVISPLFSEEDKNKLSHFLDRHNTNKSNEGTKGVFTSLLHEDLLFFEVEKRHRYEVVEMLSTALYEKGYVKKEFIHSSVNRERKSATSMGGGVAIPHGDPSLILKPALAAAVLKEPMDWGGERVSLIFMLATSKENQTEIRDVIGRIASLTETPLVLHWLIETRDYQGFVRVLEGKQN